MPAQGAASEYFNYNYNFLGTTDQAAKDYVTTLADVTLSPMPALVYQRGTVASAATLVAPRYDVITRRWVGMASVSSNRYFVFSYDGVNWAQSGVLSLFGQPQSMAMNPAGLTIALDEVAGSFYLSPNTNVPTFVTGAATGTVITSTVWFAAASLFVGVGATSAPVAKIWTSTGTANWVDRSAAVPGGVTAQQGWRAAASPTLCIALPAGAGPNVPYMSSTNATTWTAQTLPSLASEHVVDVRWSTADQQFLVLVSTSGASMKVYASTDGINWTTRFTFSSSGWIPYALGVSGVTRATWMILATRDRGDGVRVVGLYSLDAGVHWQETDLHMPAITNGNMCGIHSDGERMLCSNGTDTTAVSTMSLGARAGVT